MICLYALFFFKSAKKIELFVNVRGKNVMEMYVW